MASTLLVTTDLSTKSKGALRFAIQVARQKKQSLVFFHCLPFLKPTRWTDATYDAYAKAERENAVKSLQRFVLRAFEDAGVKKPKFECIVRQGPDIPKSILTQAREVNASAICIGTRGAGRLRKLIGTNASALIQRSNVPIFVIPGGYKRAPIKNVVYASDFNNLAFELKTVRAIAKSLKAKVSVLHYDYLVDVKERKARLMKVAKRYKSKTVRFHFKKYNVDKSLASHLLRDVKPLKTSLAVLFTNQKRGWFDRLFLSSKSVDVANAAKLPLLIIPRQ